MRRLRETAERPDYLPTEAEIERMKREIRAEREAREREEVEDQEDAEESLSETTRAWRLRA